MKPIILQAREVRAILTLLLALAICPGLRIYYCGILPNRYIPCSQPETGVVAAWLNDGRMAVRLDNGRIEIVDIKFVDHSKWEEKR